MSDNTPPNPPTGWTIIPVTYRDRGNWKSFGEYHLRGIITNEQTAALAATLEVDGTFIPAQLSEDHLNEFTPSEQDDHPFHELNLEEATTTTDKPRHSGSNHTPWTVESFLADMQAAHDAGWDPTAYPYP